jgi:hypothetical protein
MIEWPDASNLEKLTPGDESSGVTQIRLYAVT